MQPIPFRIQLRTALFLTVLLVPMVVRTTSPIPQYVEFNLHGILTRTGGGSPQDFTVGVQFHDWRAQPGQYERLFEGSQPIDLTRDDGTFAIVARSNAGYPEVTPAESLRVVVFLPGQDPLYGSPFAAGSDQSTPVMGQYEQNSDGCCEDPTTVTRQLGTIYIHEGLLVTVP